MDLIQLASLGGFAFAAGVMFLILKSLFDAVRSGELMSRVEHDDVVKRLVANNDRLIAENAELRSDLRDAVKETGRLATAVETLARRPTRRA